MNLIIRKVDDYLVIRVFKENIGDFNVLNVDSIKVFFKDILKKIQKKYKLNGIIEAEVYVYLEYGIIIELHPISFEYYSDEIDMNIHVHLDSVFLIEIDINSILDYNSVYYYKDKFYGIYSKICDNEIFYKDVDEIINNGIKVC